MKILLVTDQALKIEGNQILSDAGLRNALKRIAVMGEIHACVVDAQKLRKNVLVRNLSVNEFINKNNITFIPRSLIWPSSSTIKAIERNIKEVDLVIGYIPSLNAEVASLLTHKLGKKYFALMVACPWDGLWNQDLKRKIAAPYRFLLNRKTLREADYALYVTGEFLQNRYPTQAAKTIGISDVVLESVNDEILTKRIQKIHQYGSGQTLKIATTAMLNVRYKGQRFVLEALKMLKERGFENFEYYLIGGGKDTELRNLATKLGIEDKIKFIGKVPHKDVFKLLDDIDIYVHPSLQEGLPRSVVEAMSRALPCIGAATGAIPELLDKEFVVKRKSATEIADNLIKISDALILEQQAIRNFNKAKEFECQRLDNIRDRFYKSVASDFDI